ncbi:MAG: type II secretion system F family protein [bacterium]|nr:type II secretion system F family protein [bacterium]
MKYRYNSRTQGGELQTGFVEAVNREAASNILVGHELFLLSLEEAEGKKWYDFFIDFVNRVKPTDLMVFTRQFATLLDAKISLADSLKNLYKQTRNTILKEAISEISSDVDSGLSLSQSMDRHSNIFSDFFISMVRSAEVTGRLEESIGFMADYLEKEVGLLSRVRNALIYPIVVLVLFFIVAGIMIGVVFPQLAPIFAESGSQLPFVTKILLTSGTFISNWWFSILLIILVFAVMIIDYLRTSEGKAVLDDLRVRLPIIRGLYKKLYVARFAESASVLLKGGIPVAQTLEISGHAIGSIIYRELLHEVAESVRGGQLMSQAIAEHEDFFPPLVHQMISVGESTGKLEELLARISSFYTREVDDSVSNLVELIQPALMVVIGVLVGILFAAVLLPIYQLSQSF